MRVFVAILCGAAAGSLLIGCAAYADGPVLPLPPQDQQEVTAHLGAGVVGAALPSEPITDAASYFPLQERAMTYELTAGKSAGTTHTLQVAKGKRPNGLPAWRMGLTPSVDGFIRQTREGDLVMPAMSDTSEGVVIITTPPNPFIINGMQPGETKTFTQTVAVNYLDDPTRRDYSGTLNSTYTYVGTYQVTVPAGTYAAVLMRLQVKGTIGPAHTEDISYTFFAPGVGVVAMISQEDVEAFWVIHIDTTIGKVLSAK
jgi:hypothetical protein